MKSETLLVEVRTEELPPPAVPLLAREFPQELLRRLREGGFAGNGATPSSTLATPRRFAAMIEGIRAQAESREVSRRGPQVKDCFQGGKPSAALRGFMRAVGAEDFGELAREKDKGKEYVLWRGEKTGARLDDTLAQTVADSMRAMPDLPSMRWSENDSASFVRPVRGLVMMLGKNVVPGEVMGAKSGDTTRAHPVLAKTPAQFKRADDYIKTLREANVIVDCVKREEEVRQIIYDDDEVFFITGAGGIPGFAGEERQKLIGEIVAMCEKPLACEGAIDKEFWQLPVFCVARCLVNHQKCFPRFMDEKGKAAVSRFCFVADNAPQDGKSIVAGAESVVRARLNDVAFYLREDKKLTQESARKKLDGIVYHHKLGSQGMRAKRVAAIAGSVGKMMKLNAKDGAVLKRAAEVCKLDLSTMMVAEYPELAGKMAAEYFYGGNDPENLMVSTTVARHGDGDFEFYDGDRSAHPAVVLFLADKLEKIVGMFLAGEKPAGRRDPHGLRRAAGQIANILAPYWQSLGLRGDMPDDVVDSVAELSLNALLCAARDSFADDFDAQSVDIDEVHELIARRLSLPDINAEVVNAVYALRPDYLAEIPKRCKALQEFLQLPEAPALIAANKRINNILRKSGAGETSGIPEFSAKLLRENAEKTLHACVLKLEKETRAFLAKGDYDKALTLLANDAAKPVADFFDKVLVNAEDATLRANRMALLSKLRAQLNSVADLARLTA